MNKNKKISIIGQGYVGLPLSIELAKKFKNVIGFEKSFKRSSQLKRGIDSNKEVSKQEFKKVKNLEITNNHDKIKDSDFFIITVPTPIDSKNKPDLKSLKNASELVGKNLKKRKYRYS